MMITKMKNSAVTRKLSWLVREIVCHYNIIISWIHRWQEPLLRCLAMGPKRGIVLRIHRTVFSMPAPQRTYTFPSSPPQWFFFRNVLNEILNIYMNLYPQKPIFVWTYFQNYSNKRVGAMEMFPQSSPPSHQNTIFLKYL